MSAQTPNLRMSPELPPERSGSDPTLSAPLGESSLECGEPSGVSSMRSSRPVRVKGALIGGRYRLESLLGEGGMGTVWIASDLHLDIEVAVKLLRFEVTDADATRRFKQEARATARLVHASVVRIFDFGETEWGDPFIVMELLRGELLSVVLDRQRKLPPIQCVALMLPIISALVIAHKNGVVHRDLKPENILLCATDLGTLIPKVLDFGIARLRDSGSLRLTRTNAVIGTPDYMSPEQARGLRDVDERADVWAITVMLYECMCTSRPFEESNYNALMLTILNAVPVPTTALGAGDEDLWRIIERGLAKDREARWQTVGDLGRALAAWGVRKGMLHDITGAALHVHWPDPGAPSISGTFALGDSADPSAFISLRPVEASLAAADTANAPEGVPRLRGVDAKKTLISRVVLISWLLVALFASFAAGRGTRAQKAAPDVIEPLATLLPTVTPSLEEPPAPSAVIEPEPPPLTSVSQPAPPKNASYPRVASSAGKSALPPRAPNF